MSAPDQVIILAAGRGNQADGLAKILIRHPETQRTVLDHAIEAFAGKRVIVVVGFRAIQIMEQHPEVEYVINHDWAITHNANSLGLALDDQPTYVVSGDIFLEAALVRELDEGSPNLALVDSRENRTLTAVHCILRENNSIAETYQGQLRDAAHPEVVGLFKVSDPKVLRDWKRICINHGNMFAGLTLPFDSAPIDAHALGDHLFEEINTPLDYQRFIQKLRGQ